MSRPRRPHPQHFEHVQAVTTLASAARAYRVDRKTIRYAVDAGRVAARKDGAVWLVSVASLIAWFGPPRAG